ncbi:MAG: ComEC/Rec2 family competence protein [Acidobacteria bacterium]|nr:ComEC/Rec2 family competence protein [Acidobacteriota bacterium]
MMESSFLPRRQPFIYLTAALVVGILSEKFIAPPRALLLLLGLSSVIYALRFIGRKKATAATLHLLIGVVCSGALLAQADVKEAKNPRLIRLFEAHRFSSEDAVELTGVLIAPPEPALEGYYLEVEAQRLRVFDEVIPASGRARLVIRIADPEVQTTFQQLALDSGSRLRVLVRLERAHTYQNPGAIDFNEFLERQGYDLRGNIKSPLLIEPLGRVRVNPLFAALDHLRLRMLRTIEARFREPEAGTLKAMMLGNRYFLDAETSERLRQSATFHTLVISGMHFSLLAFALLNFPFFKRAPRTAASAKFSLSVTPRKREDLFKRPKLWRWAGAFVVLWAYALMVGLAPPVLRATLMISLGLLAPLWFRQAVSLNTICLAAFLMLALKPALVADPGFQLSFAAVAAIVSLALPLLEKCRAIGQWQPTPATPHPPNCVPVWRTVCEMLYWDERAFKREMYKAPITYGLEKSALARWLNRWRVQGWCRGVVGLLITSTAIQLFTLPLMVVYFNRVAPVGILLNIVSGLLTGILMIAASVALLAGALKFSFAGWLVKASVWTVKLAHYALVNAIHPFLDIPGMTFRAAHYEGWQASLYALYFVPIIALMVVLDHWQPTKKTPRQSATHQPQTTMEAARREAESQARHRRQQQTRRLKRLTTVSVLLILWLAMIAVIKPPARLPKGKLTIYFLDVGQGDAALVVFPQGTTMLIDGGGELAFGTARDAAREKLSAASLPQAQAQDSQITASGAEDEIEFFESGVAIGETVVSRFLWSLGLTKIDYLLATHADADHIQGLATVARNFQIKEAIVGRVVENNSEFAAFVQASRRQQAPLALLQAGEQLQIEGVSVEVLWPLRTLEPALRSANNDSLVVRLSYGANTILMTGDIERESEETLIKMGINLRAEVLKVPHHGSKTSSTEGFLEAVQPSWAIASVGQRSRFGHPHQVVVERYRKRHISLLQTGQQGLIMVQGNGQTLQISHYENRSNRN